MSAAPLPLDEDARLEVLRDLTILDSLPEQSYDDLTILASQICGAPISLVSLVDAERQWFKSRVGLDAVETPRDYAFCAHAILDPDDVLIVEDATTDPRFADNPLVTGDPDIRFYAGAPLRADDQPVGTLCVIDREPRRMTADQIAGLQALARQVEAHLALRLAVKRMRVQQRLLQQYRLQLEEEVERATSDAVTDPLTGLLNRRGLLARLIEEQQRSSRDGKPLSVAVIDLDGFKQLNDRQGHLTGDEALRQIASALTRTHRNSDVLARFGGDEFVVLLPATPPAGALAMAERFRSAIADTPWPVTASIGVATSYGVLPTQLAMIQAADDALYRAKGRGRDQVVAAPDLQGE